MITGLGLNCERETDHAFRLAGASSERVHLLDLLEGQGAPRLAGYDILAFIGVVFGALSVAIRVDPQALNGVSGLLGLGIGAVVSIEVMYRILKKKFNGFEIALLTTDEE